MQRVPFHFGIFYHAMVGLLGRRPDTENCMGYEGYYEFRYKPQNEKEAASFRENVGILAQWLDIFEIIFSGSRCEFGLPSPRQPGDKDVLQIRITIPK